MSTENKPIILETYNNIESLFFKPNLIVLEHITKANNHDPNKVILETYRHNEVVYKNIEVYIYDLSNLHFFGMIPVVREELDYGLCTFVSFKKPQRLWLLLDEYNELNLVNTLYG